MDAQAALDQNREEQRALLEKEFGEKRRTLESEYAAKEADLNNKIGDATREREELVEQQNAHRLIVEEWTVSSQAEVEKRRVELEKCSVV